jgi:CopG family transcriptional regulator / antitoxin EndoAI
MNTSHKRINITLPDKTLHLMDRVIKPGNRSSFINQAVNHYIKERSKANLREQLKEGALARAERDLAIAEEWFPLEEEVWENHRR